MNWEGKKVLVTGGSGFLGNHLVGSLEGRGADVVSFRSSEFDLRSPSEAMDLFYKYGRKSVVFHLAARVGGIGYNIENGPILFRDNILIGVNTLHAAAMAGVERFVSVGTACSYPIDAPLPFSPTDIWNGRPEETNAPYGIAKRAVIEMARTYRETGAIDAITVIPTNLYGPNDNFSESSSHVIPALIRRMVEAKDRRQSQMSVWGSGSASRDFLYITDAVQGIIQAAESYDSATPLNLGSGVEVPIRELVEIIKGEVGYTGEIVFDPSKPDGQPRRCLDTTEATMMGWSPRVSLESGIKILVDWYKWSLG